MKHSKELAHWLHLIPYQTTLSRILVFRQQLVQLNTAGELASFFLPQVTCHDSLHYSFRAHNKNKVLQND